MYKLRCMSEPKVPLQDFSEKGPAKRPRALNPKHKYQLLTYYKKKKVPLHPIIGDTSKTQSVISRVICTPMFIAASFTTAVRWK